jgi:hypothetical protein
MHSLGEGCYPILAPSQPGGKWTGKIHPSVWPEVKEKCVTGSLRHVAEEYEVSYETVRRTVREAGGPATRRVR